MTKPAWVVIAVLAIAVPPFVSPYLVHILVLILFFGFLGSAWNILGGYAGQFSFGHAAFFGIGAYTSTVLLVRGRVSPWVGLWAGGFLAAAFGCFEGYLAFRYGLRGPYFALVTLAFAEMLRLIAVNWMGVGGPMGILIPLPKGGDSLLRLQFREKLPYYYVVLALLALVLGLTRRIERVRLGYTLAAIRENEDAAEASGVNTLAAKLWAMGISSFLTALGGSFYAQYFSFIDPTLAFGVSVSVEILLRPIVGGPGTLAGPLLGSLVLTPLSELTRSFIRGRPGVDVMIYGAILVAVVTFLPRGLVGVWERARRHAPGALAG
ncbi:MAG: branched-chain amino acid ABC transporter permease [Candidatus Rokubacteria bacterium]|nr:branched-chain amino acid ABC transporter permease [Candidatus Rokubacteria bacterium]